MDTEIAPLKEQFHIALAAAPGSWVERVQQSKTPESEGTRLHLAGG
jgi:hypothetical protein